MLENYRKRLTDADYDQLWLAFELVRDQYGNSVEKFSKAYFQGMGMDFTPMELICEEFWTNILKAHCRYYNTAITKTTHN